MSLYKHTFMELVILTILSTIVLVYGDGEGQGDVDCRMVPVCGYAPKIGESLPVTEEEIFDECKDLKQFQECIGAWTKKCLSTEDAEQYNLRIEKPLKFVRALCGNQKFRLDYLNEKESFMKISTDWKQCIVDFQESAKETGMSNQNATEAKEFCCGLRSFNECTDKLCNNDCTDKAKDVLGRIIEMMRNAFEVANCKMLDLSDCPTTSGSATLFTSLIASVMPIVILLVVNH